ncbi:MAG: insulinase family protein [Bacteroidales bacterium]|nr:insulinase family protein [Bacteroidales bacterium]
MISYEKHLLDNGLTVLTHEAWDTPLATVNLLYNVGSRDEDPERTGFAHLFEHLMFGGTPRVPEFDAVVSGLGGDNNAFTTCDYTNYYITLPSDALPTALMLEADRMAHLDISAKTLEVQQHVVTEEYNQRYMNRPYGDIWLLLRPLCYQAHPYRWATIGADIKHVSQATLDDVRAFHQRFYRPDNAILAVAAPLKHCEMLRMVEEAWDSHPSTSGWDSTAMMARTDYPAEPEQTKPRFLRVQRDIPAPMVYLAYPMGDRQGRHFRACDLISDILANGTSSRLHRRLVVEQQMMVEAEACITGDAGPGMLVLSGKLQAGVTPDEAAEALRHEALALTETSVSDYELQKVQNKYENTFVLSQYKAADRALALCHYTWLGDTDLVNREPEEYRRVTPDMLLEAAREVFTPQHENRLYYEQL